ncbi:MAG: ATP-binding protein, partial [Planctomycetota bacterium]
ARIESGKMSIENRACSPREVIQDVVKMMNPRAKERSLELKVEVQDEIPEGIVSDPTRLRQILLNLVGNALKFTEQGSIEIKLGMDQTTGDSSILQFEVQDTGIGIAKEDVVRLFDAFTQADTSTTRRFGGAGLGLSISRRLAQMLGGDIRVRSKPGEGSTFTVWLQAVAQDLPGLSKAEEAIAEREASDAAKTAAPLEALPASSPARKAHSLSGRVLLVEDFAPTQRLLRALLERAGAEVVTSNNGQEALDRVNEAGRDGAPFDLILMDMQMPVLDGYRATAQLREKGIDSPIVALTAHALEGDREKCLDAGCDEYVTKPIDRRHFFDLCSKLLSGKESGSEPPAPLPGRSSADSITQA